MIWRSNRKDRINPCNSILAIWSVQFDLFYKLSKEVPGSFFITYFSKAQIHHRNENPKKTLVKLLRWQVEYGTDQIDLTKSNCKDQIARSEIILSKNGTKNLLRIDPCNFDPFNLVKLSMFDDISVCNLEFILSTTFLYLFLTWTL